MNHTTKEQKSIEELKEVLHLDAVINTYVHGMIDNSSYKHIQDAFLVAMEAIQRQSNTIIEPINNECSIPFIGGNYSNKCVYCGSVFHNTDKHWFACQKCCSDIDAAIIKKESNTNDEPIKDEELIKKVKDIILAENKFPYGNAEEKAKECVEVFKKYAASLNNTVEKKVTQK